MSGFILGYTGSGANCVLTPNDERVASKDYAWDRREQPVQLYVYQPGIFWSGSSFTGGGATGGSNYSQDAFDQQKNRWDIDLAPGGNQSQKKLIGTSRDNSGNALGSCIIQGFTTVGDVFVGQVTSDTAGYFELPTQYSGANHYLVAYLAGSPDVAGTTVNTLVPV